jgi:hypothetical protein
MSCRKRGLAIISRCTFREERASTTSWFHARLQSAPEKSHSNMQEANDHQCLTMTLDHTKMSFLPGFINVFGLLSRTNEGLYGINSLEARRPVPRRP